MKQFFRMIFASMIGTSLAMILVFFFMIATMVGMVGMSSSDGWKSSLVQGDDKNILRIEIDGPLVDRVQRMDLFESAFSDAPPTIGLFELTQTLKAAAKDNKIKGLYIHIYNLLAGSADVESLRREIGKFKDSGKFVIVYAENYDEKTYVLASVADEIALYPRGYFEWNGIFATLGFFKNTLKKLDIVPEIFRAGKYKSAIEPFINDKMSPESREQLQSLMLSIWGHYSKLVAERTTVDEKDLESWANDMSVMYAKDALERGFVNYLASYEEIESKLMELTGAKEEPGFFDWTEYYKSKVKDKGNRSKNKIAVIFAAGEIVSSGSDRGIISAREYSKILRKISKEEDIKGVVFRVDSPGGSALASDVIWTSTQFVKDKKPIVASFGNMAASGGYYLSAGCNHIMAEETTITGSIGVFGLNFMLEKFWRENAGVTWDTEKTHKMADLETTVRPLKDIEKRKMQDMVDHIYGDFLNVVTQGRASLETVQQTNEIAQGRVWAATAAKDIGLVDSYGGLEEAIQKTVELAKLEDYEIVAFPEEKNPFEELLSSWGDVSLRILQRVLPRSFMRYIDMVEPKPSLSDQIYTRMPFDLEWN